MAGGSCNLRMVRMSGAGARLFFLPCDILTILSTHTRSVAVWAMTVGHTGLKCRRALVQGCKYVIICCFLTFPTPDLKTRTWKHSSSRTAISLFDCPQYKGTGPIFTVQGYWTNLHSTRVLDNYHHFTYISTRPNNLLFAFCVGLNVLPADWYLRGLPVAEGLSHYDARFNRLCYAECARGALSFFFSTRIESYGCIPSSRITYYIL